VGDWFCSSRLRLATACDTDGAQGSKGWSDFCSGAPQRMRDVQPIISHWLEEKQQVHNKTPVIAGRCQRLIAVACAQLPPRGGVNRQLAEIRSLPPLCHAIAAAAAATAVRGWC
jgi:hypothetical protein